MSPKQVSSTFEHGRFETQDVLYAGNRGPRRTGIEDAFGGGPVGHARLSCVFRSDSWALCNGKIEIAGGTMLARNVFVHFGGDTTVVEINGGTGEFAGKHGSVRSVSLTDSVSLFTINFG